MQQAIEAARDNFRYFYRELSWETRRIVPGLSMSAIKAPFTDEGKPLGLFHKIRRKLFGKWKPAHEQMWINELSFDGDVLVGTLVNEPNWLKSVKVGDSVEVPLEEVSDWMYVINDHAYGGFTVQAIRKTMSAAERRAHDAAWGLTFPNPDSVKLYPEDWEDTQEGPQEHPMARNVVSMFTEQLSENPQLLTATDERGWALLHQLAASGTCCCTEVAIKYGADVHAKTNTGHTPLSLAKRLGWPHVAELLQQHGARDIN